MTGRFEPEHFRTRAAAGKPGIPPRNQPNRIALPEMTLYAVLRRPGTQVD